MEIAAYFLEGTSYSKPTDNPDYRFFSLGSVYLFSVLGLVTSTFLYLVHVTRQIINNIFTCSLVPGERVPPFKDHLGMHSTTGYGFQLFWSELLHRF